MHLEYNGVKLELVEITECTREAVYDPTGTDLLFVRWRLGLVCTLGSGGSPPGTQLDAVRRNQWNSTKTDIAGSNPVSVPRDVPQTMGTEVDEGDWDDLTPATKDAAELRNQAFLTDHELRMRLMIPRRKLRITAYNPDGTEYVWVEAPRQWQPFTQVAAGGSQGTAGVEGINVDADNGPKPLRCDVVQPTGEGNTMGVHFVVEFATTPTAPESDRLILSHRWQTTMTHDDDFYLTRTTVGEIRFNGSILHAARQQPDWFRGQFFHPIPLGFRRGGPIVRLSGDGLVLQYEIHDTDPTVTFDPGDSGATEMTIVETVNVLNRRMMVGHAVNFMKGMGKSFLDGLGIGMPKLPGAGWFPWGGVASRLFGG
jgi:hypothetical protein